jgi:hypothetical protein
MSLKRWSYLDPYFLKYLRSRIEAYDQIMAMTEDVKIIAKSYQISLEEVQQAKNYAFGEGVSRYQFIPDLDMAQAWQRMAQKQGKKLDEVLLRHEVMESDLVINKGLNQLIAHNLTQEKYPWSELLKLEEKS